MRSILRNILHSFSVQLLLLHLRSNFLLLLVWVLLILMMSGLLGPNLGLQYLFLDPEYLGETGFSSFLLLGLAFGFFVMSWNLSTYLLTGGYFNFLASLSRPFFKFCINNALLPLGFFLFYCGLLIWFHNPKQYGQTDRWLAVESLSGLVMGLILSLFLYAIYFNLTNRDIGYYKPKHRIPPPNMGPGRGRQTSGYRPYRARALAPVLAGLYDNPYDVTTYLNENLKTRLVRSVSHYDSSILQSIFRQNHLNALIIQLVAIVGLCFLGLLIDQPVFQIPAGASFLILFSLLISIIGAVSYWFSEWRFLFLLLLAIMVNFLTSGPLVRRGNEAYGLNYSTSKADYSEAHLSSVYRSNRVAEDLVNTRNILEAWKARQPAEKPPLVIVCASGGGLTAALWATHVTQELEAASSGRFLRGTALMTGASGGQLGLAYVREAYLSDPNFMGNANLRLHRIGRDVLNPVAFSIVSNDLFLPYTRFQEGGKTYRRDRAYNFEREFLKNTDVGLEKPLWAYREPEQKAEIPLLFLTPSVVEDGRRMVISPQGVSYMMAAPDALNGRLPLSPDMVDFRWLLEEQDADSLRFSTALRMNATYPYVLPLVQLPTHPVIRLMDAGYRDNYGVVSAVRFVSAFEDWIRANTSGVHIVQISAFREPDQPAEMKEDRPGIVESLFSPVGVAGNILGVQILDQEVLLGQLASHLGPDLFHLHRFNFQPAANDPLRTSVSLHLTEREKTLVLRAVDTQEMQERIQGVVKMLNETDHQ